MNSLIRYLDRIQQKVEKALLFFGACLTIILLLLITVDVILRKLSQPIPGSYETVQVMTVGIVFLGVAYVQSIKGHVFIEIATEKFPKKVQQGLDFFGYIIGLAICFIITWQSGIAAWESSLMMEAASGIAKIPIWPAKIVIFLGMGLLTLRLLLDIVYYFFPRVLIDQLKTIKDENEVQEDQNNMQIKEAEEIWN